MSRIALRMLFGRRGTYAAMVFGISFAVLLLTQQVSVLLGMLLRATGPLQNIGNADIWVASRTTEHAMTSRWIRDQSRFQIRSIHGVEWAEPFFFTIALAEVPDGSFQHVELIGIDRSTMIGQPPQMLRGTLTDLHRRDAVLVEASQLEKLPGIRVGSVLRINEQRARVTGICRAKAGILSRPMIYTTYRNALHLIPNSRHRTHWILVRLKPGADLTAVCHEIQRRCQLRAFPAGELRWVTMQHVMSRTSVGINFVVCVALGIVVGLVISAATFHQFTSENLTHFAVLKAVGASPWTLIRMVVLQALTTGLISYGIGVGISAGLNLLARHLDSEIIMHFPWQLLLIALAPMLLCITLGSLMSLWRVLRLDPGIVF